jgi:biopolymer transport protein ExbB
MRKALTALLLAALLPATAHAWWNADWSERARITLNTSAQGLETRETVSGASVAVRLHSGNFDFTAAKEDGSDLRVIAGDDKTPLKFSIERFDAVNELAVLWVQLPSVLPGTDKNVFHVYAGNPAATAEAATGNGFDAATVIALHFSDQPAGADQLGAVKPQGTLVTEPNGLLAASARLTGEPIVYALSDKPVVDAGQQLTVSLWMRLDEVQRATLLRWGGLSLGVEGGQVVMRADRAELRGGELLAARWSQVALRLGLGKATLFVNGTQVAQGDAATPALGSSLALGEGARGLMDEVQLAAALRSADWIAVAAGTQGAEGRLVASVRESRDSPAADGESHGYMGILVKNLTVDAWVVIIILAVMFAIACWVMVAKGLLVSKVAKANRSFVLKFREADEGLLTLETHAPHPESPIYRLYQAGVRELAKRKVGQAGSAPLSGASLDAVKASVDADYVRENARLNSGMVLLTIAISGGPFLGLLGTVVGVMITFAAIAAAGDVNVNAIAPGIAAALLATVAGLGVAIPALFGYNWLASQIKNATSDMQIFIDEFITRVAELYGAR